MRIGKSQSGASLSVYEGRRRYGALLHGARLHIRPAETEPMNLSAKRLDLRTEVRGRLVRTDRTLSSDRGRDAQF
jgi:hypothetical protein